MLKLKKMNVFDKKNFDVELLSEANFEGTLESFTVFVPTDAVNLSRVPDDYDYDMETSHNTFFWDELLPTLIVYCLTFVLGLVGNVLIIFTIFRYRKMKSTTNVFLASLASSDLLLILFCIPVKGFSRNFSSIFSSNEPELRTQSTLQNLSQPSNSAYCQMKAVLDTFLIKEADEIEEKVYLKHHLEKSFISPSSSESVVENEISPFDMEDSLFSHSTSEKLTLMESTLCSSDTRSKLELLMAKLSEEIKKCSDFMKDIYSHKTKRVVTLSSPKLCASDSKIELNRNTSVEISKKSLNSSGWTTSEPLVYPLFAFSADMSFDDEDDDELSRKKANKKNQIINESKKEELDVLQKPMEKNLNVLDSPSPSPPPPPPPPPPLFPQSPENLESKKSVGSIFSCKSASSTETLRTNQTSKKLQNTLKEYPCCDDCRLLKRRIMKLEKELEKIEKRMPLYPKEYQESIKNCLESLNVTSETFLKRLRSCAKLRYFDSKNRKICKNDSKRSMSSPGPIIFKRSKKKLSIKPSNSDYQLNVGMEITMENVDPVTGKKLHPESNRNTEQEGNIQCRVIKDGEKPVLVMDTDFCYNPTTGMLFKKQGSHSTKSPSTDLIIPIDSVIKKSPSAFNLMGNFEKLKTYTCSEVKNKPLDSELVRPKTPKKSQKNLALQVEPSIVADAEVMADVFPTLFSSNKSKSIDSTEIESTIDTAASPKSKLSLDYVCNLKDKQSRSRSTSRERKKSKRIPWFIRKKSEQSEKCSRIPIRRKPTPSSTPSKADTMSLQNSMTSFLNIPLQPKCHPTSSTTSGIIFKLAKLFSFTWTFGFFLCKLVHYMQSVSAICSVLTLTAMSLERYYAIVHPMKAQYICTISQARRIITATWISSFLLAVPILFAQVHLKVGVKVEAFWCVRDWDNRTIWRAHELYMMLLILVVPTGIMAVAYTAICLEIWEVIQRRQDMTSGKGAGIYRKPRLARNLSNDSLASSVYKNNTKLDSKRRPRGLFKKEMADDGASVKQVIKMLVAVVVIYVICWGPMLIDNVLQAYGILSHIRIGWLKYMGTAFHLMAYFNSCINPIIYGFMSKNFRDSFRKTLCCVRKKPKTAYRSFSLSQTRNTSIRYAESSFSRTISIALQV